MAQRKQPERACIRFEEDIRRVVEALGYSGVRTPSSGDRGIDVVATRGDRTVAIQCKLYGRTLVDTDTILRLLAARVWLRATDFLCITTGRYTGPAKKLGGECGVVLIDGNGLRSVCAENQFLLPTHTCLKGAGGVYGLDGDEVLIGREGGNHIQVNQRSVSRRHAKLWRNGLEVYVCDLGSTYGTRVNGEAVRGERRIGYGDELGFGEASFEVVYRRTP